jgi:acetyl-CoA synthetase
VQPTAAEDPMLVYFTSGTTGYPKMVLHTQASYGIGHELTARFWQDLHETDLHWTFSDTGWAKAAWGKMFGQWRMGAAVFLWDVRGKPDFGRMLGLLGEHRVTTFCAPPTVFRAAVLLDLRSFDWSSLRHVVSAGEPLNPDVIEVWREATGLPIYDGYGQTETVNIVANYRCLPIREGSMGKPVPGVDVRVVDDDGHPLGPGETGNIAVRWRPERPVGLFTEYWRDPEATAASFRGDWYFTGDLASEDEDGYLWFVGRADDVITSSAYRIGPFEVESAIVEHRAVAEAAVVGKPDPLRGQIVKAFVALKPGFEPSDELARDIQEHVKRATAPYKYPREIEFVSELPKTVSGKIRRVELRERERQSLSDT